jgi:glutamate-1-semialdehyde 2,1-aminomutase
MVKEPMDRTSDTANVDDTRYKRSVALRERCHALIPGGAHTYAKGDDQFPESAPGLIARGQGCRVWDVDGNEFIEWGMGLRAVSLGHAYPEVVEAACEQARLGNNFSRPSPVELECAEALLELVPQADMVKFTKDGSSADTAAVKLARAVTGRSRVAICREQPFFSYDDWFIVTTEMQRGIPPGVADLTLTFRYNDLRSLESLFERYPDEIACVVLEAERTEPPQEGFLTGVQELCRTTGALLVLDEMVTGFRWHIGGAQAYYGLDPDLSTFGKAIANGFALSALAGKREYMELGGLRTPEERVFLLSTTHGAENSALAAAIATMRVYREKNVIDVLWRQGERLMTGLAEAIRDAGVAEYFGVSGKPPCLLYWTRGPDGKPSQPFRTLFLQETIARGIIAPNLIISFSHDDNAVDRTVTAVAGALHVYAQALEHGVERFLRGRPVKPASRRFN